MTAEQVASIYKLRWKIETFFKWWKQHLSVYHLIARSEYGLMIQILAGMITYLLMSIYCNKKYKEHVSIKRFRQLRIDIKNELKNSNMANEKFENMNNKTRPVKEMRDKYKINAKT